MANSVPAERIENLAASIGEVAYIDVAKWHLYLNDAKLHTQVAQQLYPMIEEDRISESGISEVLQDISVSLGGGKKEVKLGDLIPSSCMADLVRTLEDFKDKY